MKHPQKFSLTGGDQMNTTSRPMRCRVRSSLKKQMAVKSEGTPMPFGNSLSYYDSLVPFVFFFSDRYLCERGHNVLSCVCLKMLHEDDFKQR